MKNAWKGLVWLGLSLCLVLPANPAEEGMWPISEIKKIDLAARGLNLAAQDIFNPEGTGLVNGIVQFPGCTGSFVSSQGLLLTNHHCAFGAIRAASSKDRDYLKNGFLAEDLEQEIPAKGFNVRITESCRDVSADVLAVVKPSLSPAERARAVEMRMKEIVAQEEAISPGRRAEVAEMVPGRSYWLFIYTFLRDIRLVYAPPLGIGNFGGEEDNWNWPRHTGDFSFMRAYVGPDGQPADYSERNIPYRPRVHLQVAAQGVKEGDAVFIPGYPGRTYRHMTSHHLAHEQNFRMPYVVEWNDYQIKLMEKMGEADRTVALKLAERIKSLANTLKNYRGKLQGMARLGLVNRRKAEEEGLQKFIEADPGRRARYGRLLEEIGRVYEEMTGRARQELLLSSFRSSPILFNLALTVYEASLERQKPDLERESAYMDRTFSQTKDKLLQSLKELYEPADRFILYQLLKAAGSLPPADRFPALDEIFIEGYVQEGIEVYLDLLYNKTQLTAEKSLEQALSMTPHQLQSLADPAIALAAAMYPEFLKLREMEKTRKGTLDQLLPQWMEVKLEFLAKGFIPDANRTLRVTFGRIKGYSPHDAVFYGPVTTLEGVVEKTKAYEPFNAPRALLDLYKARDFGRFATAGFSSVPVCILYDADTTGGNSGSPVLNARGELVGVNFDRTFEATINDFAWSQDYSRSIAVDIRYVLWVVQKFARADRLLLEMNIVP